MVAPTSCPLSPTATIGDYIEAVSELGARSKIEYLISLQPARAFTATRTVDPADNHSSLRQGFGSNNSKGNGDESVGSFHSEHMSTLSFVFPRGTSGKQVDSWLCLKVSAIKHAYTSTYMYQFLFLFLFVFYISNSGSSFIIKISFSSSSSC